MCKELGPVMMAVLIAGRIGSAMAAEIGSMRVYQEIDALRTMNINPVHYLVLPRMVAITIALPMLLIFSVLVGWIGGALVCVYNHEIAISWGSYFGNLRDVVEVKNVLNGLIKIVVFALIIGNVSCHQAWPLSEAPAALGAR